MLTPREGYTSAIAAAARRERAGVSHPEGWTPYVLAALGGAGAMCLWLKLGALVGWRAVGPGTFDGGVVAGALVVGALLSVAGQCAWGRLGPLVAARLGGDAQARDLRLAWGAAAFPQIFILLLLPVDIVVAGPGAFTTAPLADSIVTAWVALSAAVGTSLATWSAWLFVRGMEVATDLRPWRALVVALGAAMCLALVVSAFAWVGKFAIGGVPS